MKRGLLWAMLGLALTGCGGLSNPGAWERAMTLQRASSTMEAGVPHYHDGRYYVDGRGPREQLADDFGHQQ